MFSVTVLSLCLKSVVQLHFSNRVSEPAKSRNASRISRIETFELNCSSILVSDIKLVITYRKMHRFDVL